MADLKPNEPFEVTYPDGASPGVLVKLGKAVSTGVGPDGDVVGFSTLCPHKGFPLRYNPGDRAFDCPGHYSRFDAENAGMQIWGQATQNLAQFQLTVEPGLRPSLSRCAPKGRRIGRARFIQAIGG